MFGNSGIGCPDSHIALFHCIFANDSMWGGSSCSDPYLSSQIFSKPLLDSLPSPFKDCFLDLVSVVDGWSSYGLRTECLCICRCPLTVELPVVHCVNVGLGDNVVGCNHCQEYMISQYDIRFLFLTGIARTGHTGVCVSDFPGWIFNEKVGLQNPYVFVNLVCVAGTSECRENARAANRVGAVEPLKLQISLKLCHFGYFACSIVVGMGSLGQEKAAKDQGCW